VISSSFWHSRFGTEPSVVGKTVQVNGTPVTIVGVIEPEFHGVQRTVDRAPDISLPLAHEPLLNPFPPTSGPPRLNQPTYWWLQVMGRLQPGVTAAQVEGNLEGIFQSTARAGMDGYLASLDEAARSTAVNRRRTQVPRLEVDSAARGIYDVHTNELRQVTILSVVVGLVLLIVCANVANLLLSRATGRQKELSVRLSLGATRARLIRQLLTESLLLSAAGGGLGIVVGYWGKQLLPGAHGEPPPLDLRMLAFVTALACLTGVLFGIVPALRATSMNVSDSLKSGSRSVVSTRGLLARSLLVLQVAVSLVLLVGAGLFLRTLHNLRQVEVGFDPRNLALFRVSPALNRYDADRTNALYASLFERIGAVPGVRSVSFSQPALLSGSTNTTSIHIQGRPSTTKDDSIHRMVIAPTFFDTMGVRVRDGRAFSWNDNGSAPKVVVINDAAARRFFPGESPIGRRFGSSVETAGELEIVGVVSDAKYDSLRDAAPPTMYVPYLQARATNPVFAVRTSGPPLRAMPDIRTAVAQVDQNLPLIDVSTQLEQVEGRFAQERLFAQAYALFGALAVTLAAIGLFGLMSYNVSRRINEIGIRMALGAQRQAVLRLVLRESMILVAVGVAIGLGVALSVSRFLETLLFGLPPTDVIAIVLAVLVLVLVSSVAGYVPARRASRVDPMVALRYD
jgi:predicted permease